MHEQDECEEMTVDEETGENNSGHLDKASLYA